MFANVFGQSILGLTASQQVNPQTAPPSIQPTAWGSLHNQQPMTTQQLAHQANQLFGQAYNQYLGQSYGQSLAAQQNIAAQQMMRAAMARQQHQWMVNGRTMTFDEFLDEVCPDPDDPHRTYLTLKYKGIR